MSEKTGVLPDMETSSPSAEQVIAYLRQHPDFFVEHEELLASLRLPHRRGGTVSLVERQMDVLRKRLRGAQGQLQDLVGVARENEQLFNRTRRLTLSLLEADSVEAIIELVQDRFRSDFATDVASLILIGDDDAVDGLHQLAPDAMGQELVDLCRQRKAHSGQFDGKVLHKVFPLDPDSVQSALICPIGHPFAGSESAPLALLALGSFDADYFHEELDTAFLDYVRDVLARRLATLQSSEPDVR